MRVINKAKKRAQQIVPGLTRKINELQLELDRTLNDHDLSETQKVEQARKLKIKVTDLEQTRMQKLHRDNQTRHRLERELPSRYMSQRSKIKKPRDMLYALRKPSATLDAHGNTPGAAYEKDSRKMATLAKEYHENLQQNGIDPNNEERRSAIIHEVLNSIETQANEEQQRKLAGLLKKSDIEKALKLTKNHSAPGIDGAPYELWKAIHRKPSMISAYME
ncbi:hypothetical protein F5877DRAFT_87010 [Lentinula edodes]|nr:hypothetical protein F5877DRAFT_87010 [Lentinula edodes]